MKLHDALAWELESRCLYRSHRQGVGKACKMDNYSPAAVNKGFTKPSTTVSLLLFS